MTLNLTECNRDFENPTRAEACVMSTLADHKENPLYSKSNGCYNNQQNIVYEELHSDDIVINECLYDTADGGLLGECTREHKDNKKDTQGNAHLEAVYDLPLNITTSEDNNCYSTLGSTYFQLQPHVFKSIQQNFPPNEDEYSCLQHL